MRLPALIITLTILSAALPAVAQTSPSDYTQGNNAHQVETQPTAPTSSWLSHFTWEADIGSGIELNGNNMSSVLIDAGFGYKNDFINFAGVGAGINVMLNNGSRLFPVYAMLRTGFRPRPTIVFFDLRAGCSFNSIDNSTSQVGFFGSAGVGFNLATGRTFKSYIIAGYSYTGLQSYTDKSGQRQDLSDINAAVIRLGISF